jgi:hypothetical protein
MVSPHTVAPDDFTVKRLIRLSRASSSMAEISAPTPKSVDRSTFEREVSTDAVPVIVESDDDAPDDAAPLSPPIDRAC